MLDSLVVLLRAATFVSLLQAAGVVLLLGLFKSNLTVSKHPICLLGGRAAFFGIFLILARYLIEPARFTGSLTGIFDISIHEFLITSNLGVTQLLRLLGLIIVGISLRGSSDIRQRIGFFGVILIVSSFSFMGHTAASEQRWIISILLTIHLLLAAFWFGALVPLRLISSLETATMAGRLIGHFSKVAVYTVPLILLAGLGITVLLLPSINSLRTPYGILLISKTVGFIALMGVAALNKFKLVPSIATGSERSLKSFKRVVSFEILLIVLVLTLTATMTTLYSPEQ